MNFSTIYQCVIPSVLQSEWSLYLVKIKNIMEVNGDCLLNLIAQSVTVINKKSHSSIHLQEITHISVVLVTL